MSDGDVSCAVCLASSSEIGPLRMSLFLVRPYSFKAAGSATGPDHLNPQHLKELTSPLVSEAGSQSSSIFNLTIASVLFLGYIATYCCLPSIF